MTETASFAAETIRMLYPEPWTATKSRVRDGREHRGYLFVPNTSSARMIVPAGPPGLLAATMRRYTPGGRPSVRMKRLAFGAFAASGLAGIGWPYRLYLAGAPDADSLERWLERRLGLPPCRLAIRLGRPRANRKPVVQVLDRNGVVRAYVKIGHDALNTSLVATEAGVLARLERAGLRGVRVPRVLAHDEWNGLRLLALEPLPVSRAVADPAVVRDAAEQIAASTVRRHARWRGSSFRGRLVTAIEAGGGRLAPLNTVVETLDRTDPVIEFGAWHGDFNPGNFAAGPDGLLVWDWERYENDVPVGFDMLHLTIHREITVNGREPREVAAEVLAGAGAPIGTEGARLYLAWLACRYVADGQDRAGARLGEVERWIVPALAGAR